LPNIKRNADWFRITSTPGEGTNLSFTVYFRPRDAAEQPAHSLMVRGRLCRECLACVRACPTQALRLRGGEPLLIEHLCIDCGACIRACDTGALGVVSSTGLPKPTKDTLLLLPTAFFVQFGAGVAPARVLAALKELGYGEALVAAPWQAALRKAVVDYARREARQWPVISPVCPAVVNLIEARFPALIDAVAPFASPIEAMIQAHAGRRIVAVVSCPAERTALEPACASGSVEAIAPGQLQERLRPFLANAQQGFSGKGRSRGRRVEGAAGVLLVRGISHATAALEKAEGGLLGDACVIEPYACDGGCFGSPLLGEDPFVAESRWQGVDLAGDAPARALRRKKPFQGRPGVRLHEDMSVAIEMLSRIDELVKRLPGKDCALCGAPTCLSFAEDVVLGRASEQACVQGGPSQENAR